MSKKRTAYKGWVVTNLGRPVYPTFSTLRRVAISRWSHGGSERWDDYHKRGLVKAEKCSLILDRDC